MDKISGIFYTEDATFEGDAYFLGFSWCIKTFDGKEFEYPHIFLDRNRAILAPINNDIKESSEKKIKDFLERYKIEAQDLREDIEALKISGLKMKLRMLESYIFEYEKIYKEFFMTPSVRFILDL